MSAERRFTEDILERDPLQALLYQLLITRQQRRLQICIRIKTQRQRFSAVQRGEQERAGFRVQIYSSNHPQRGKSEALQLEQRVKQTVNVPVYVIYASPSWKVRLGDFLTEQEAAEFRDSVRELFPDLADYTYIVRDQIKTR